MLQRKYSSLREPKKIVKVRLMCQDRKDETWSVASSVEVCSLKESYKQKNKIELSQDMVWMFNGREIHDDDRMFEIGMKYKRENVIMIMKRNTDRPLIEKDSNTFNGTPIDQVTILNDEEHEKPLDKYTDFYTDLTGDEYFNSSETDEDYNDRQNRFEKMKKVKEASQKRKDRQTSSVKLAEQVENYKGNLEMGEILKNIGEHNVEINQKSRKGKNRKKKSNSRTKLKESPPENLEQKTTVERKENDKKVDVNDRKVFIEQSTESTDDDLDLSSWEKVSKGSRKKPKNLDMENKPKVGKHKKFIVKSFDESWPALESNPSYKRTILSSRNSAENIETCLSSEKNDFFFDNVVDQNEKSLDESDCNANIKEFKEVADYNANIKVTEEEVFSSISENGCWKLNKANEMAKESNTAPSNISVNCQQEQNVDLGSNADIGKANDSQVTMSQLMTSKIEPSSHPLPKVTNDLKSSNVRQELSPTSKTTEHKILTANVPGVKEFITDCLPKIEKDFFCPIKTCPLVSDVVPFGPQTKTASHFQTIPRSASNINIKSPFGCQTASFLNAGETENSEYGSSTDNAKLNNSNEGILCAVVSREVTANADLTASSSQSSLAHINDRDTEDELAAIQPNWIPEGEDTCTPASPQDSDELAVLREKMFTPSRDVSLELLQCQASYGTKDQEDSEPVQATDAHETQSVTSQPEIPPQSVSSLPQPGLVVSQQNYLLPPVLPVENLPDDAPAKSPVTALSDSSLSFGFDSAETPPANISSDDKTYEGTLERPHNLLHPKSLKDLHIIEEGNFSSNLSDDPIVKPPEHLLSPLLDDQPPGAPESGQQIVFLQPLLFFCAPQVPQLPCVPQVNVASFSGTSQQPDAFSSTSKKSNTLPGASQQPHAFSGTSYHPDAFSGTFQPPDAFSLTSYHPDTLSSTLQPTDAFSGTFQPPDAFSLTSYHPDALSGTLQPTDAFSGMYGTFQPPDAFSGTSYHPDALSGTFQQPDAFSGTSHQSDEFSGTFQQPQSYVRNRFSDSTQVPVMLTLPPEQQSFDLPPLQTYLSAQHLSQQYQLVGTGQLHHVKALQHSEQLPGGVQQEQQMFSGLPQPQQQFFDGQYPQLSNVGVQLLPFHQQPQLSSAQHHLPSLLQQKFPFVQQHHLPSVQLQHQLPSLQQQEQHLPSLQHQHLPSIPQQHLPSIHQQEQHLSSLQQQHLPYVQQQLSSIQEQKLPFLQQHLIPSLQRQQQLSPVQQQQLSSVQQQQLSSVQQQYLPSLLQQQLPSVQQQHLPSVQQQKLSSVQQQHLPFLQQQQVPFVQQQLPFLHQHLLPALEQQRPYVQQQFSSVNLPQQQQQLQQQLLPQSHLYLPVEHSQHQQVLGSSEQQQILGVPQAHQVLHVHQISGVNQSYEPQENSAP